MKFWFRLIKILLVWLVGHFFIKAYNLTIFSAINGFKIEIFSTFMIWMTALVEGHFAILLMIFFYRKRRGYLWSMLPSILLIPVVIQVLKFYFSMPRPLAFLDANSFFLGSFSLTSNSFPSGHSAAAMLVAFFFSLTEESKLKKIFFFSLAFLGGISRIYIGVHFPIDVWHGWMIAFLLMSLNLEIIERKGWLYLWKNTLAESFLLQLLALLTSILFLLSHEVREPFIEQQLIFLFSIFTFYFFVRVILELFVVVKRIKRRQRKYA